MDFRKFATSASDWYMCVILRLHLVVKWQQCKPPYAALWCTHIHHVFSGFWTMIPSKVTFQVAYQIYTTSNYTCKTCKFVLQLNFLFHLIFGELLAGESRHTPATITPSAHGNASRTLRHFHKPRRLWPPRAHPGDKNRELHSPLNTWLSISHHRNSKTTGGMRKDTLPPSLYSGRASAMLLTKPIEQIVAILSADRPRCTIPTPVLRNYRSSQRRTLFDLRRCRVKTPCERLGEHHMLE